MSKNEIVSDPIHHPVMNDTQLQKLLNSIHEIDNAGNKAAINRFDVDLLTEACVNGHNGKYDILEGAKLLNMDSTGFRDWYAQVRFATENLSETRKPRDSVALDACNRTAEMWPPVDSFLNELRDRSCDANTEYHRQGYETFTAMLPGVSSVLPNKVISPTNEEIEKYRELANLAIDLASVFRLKNWHFGPQVSHMLMRAEKLRHDDPAQFNDAIRTWRAQSWPGVAGKYLYNCLVCLDNVMERLQLQSYSMFEVSFSTIEDEDISRELDLIKEYATVFLESITKLKPDNDMPRDTSNPSNQSPKKKSKSKRGRPRISETEAKKRKAFFDGWSDAKGGGRSFSDYCEDEGVSIEEGRAFNQWVKDNSQE